MSICQKHKTKTSFQQALSVQCKTALVAE